MSRLKTAPILEVLNRPNLLMGAERKLVLSTGLMCAILIGVTLTIVGAVTGVVLWIFLLGVFQAMAKADPWMSEVAWRHYKYKARYSARSAPWRL